MNCDGELNRNGGFKKIPIPNDSRAYLMIAKKTDAFSPMQKWVIYFKFCQRSLSSQKPAYSIGHSKSNGTTWIPVEQGVRGYNR